MTGDLTRHFNCASAARRDACRPTLVYERCSRGQGGEMNEQGTVDSPGFFANVWRQKWLIVLTSALTLAATAMWSHFFLSVRYQSEGELQVVPIRMPLGDPPIVRVTPERIQLISQLLFSRTRLETLVGEFKLYETDQESR
jgi:uncharacterized protein involved in exopolysaccharide biosynthesis